MNHLLWKTQIENNKKIIKKKNLIRIKSNKARSKRKNGSGTLSQIPLPLSVSVPKSTGNSRLLIPQISVTLDVDSLALTLVRRGAEATLIGLPGQQKACLHGAIETHCRFRAD